MTLTLHLGVIELPYVNAPDDVNKPRHAKALPPTKSGQPRKARAKKHGPWLPGTKVHAGEQTTGDVATWLENKYHVMEAYFATNEQKVADALAESMKDALETQLMGGPGGDPYADAGEEISQGFREFLGNGDIEKLGLSGIPTAAAQRGVNHRLKLKRGDPRPSFIDRGLYQSSFKAWVD